LLQKTAIKILPLLNEIIKKMALEDNRSPEDGGNYITGPTKLGKSGLNEIKGQKNILEYLENDAKIKISEDKRQKI
jgi:hypothetical protein